MHKFNEMKSTSVSKLLQPVGSVPKFKFNSSQNVNLHFYNFPRILIFASFYFSPFKMCYDVISTVYLKKESQNIPLNEHYPSNWGKVKQRDNLK